VVADRTVLEPEKTEADSLERHQRNPRCREQVTFAAPHDNIAPHSVAAEVETPRDDDQPDDKQTYDD
jgi:hypothetical protein